MKDFTDITLLIDESQSMQQIKEATLEGINSFILAQQRLDVPATLTLATFSEPVYQARFGRPRQNFDPCEYIYECKPIKRVGVLTKRDYDPIGARTALYDALGHLIDNTGNRLEITMEKDRPTRVIMVVMTDGEENASLHFNKFKVREMIEHQRSKYNWQFLYLGANQDAFKVGGSIGVPAHQCMQYDHNAIGTKSAFIGTQCAVADYSRGAPASFAPKK